MNSNTVDLYNCNTPKKKLIKVDFTSKKNIYRCCKSNLKNEILSKAVGIKQNYSPIVLDATAGFGRDAFILSYLGCHVTMIERNPVIAALLKDGLERAYTDKKIGSWLKKRLFLIFNNSFNMLNFPISQPDVIYLDPMYPLHNKKALPKKEIQFIRKLVGLDYDAEDLLKISRKFAKKRIIVKRPHYAKTLSKEKADFVIKSKNHRFDVYNPL